MKRENRRRTQYLSRILDENGGQSRRNWRFDFFKADRVDKNGGQIIRRRTDEEHNFDFQRLTKWTKMADRLDEG